MIKSGLKSNSASITCTLHTPSLSLSEAQAHSTDATVDERTNSKSQRTITALSSSSALCFNQEMCR